MGRAIVRAAAALCAVVALSVGPVAISGASTRTQRAHLEAVLAGRLTALTALQSTVTSANLSSQHALVLYALVSSEHANLVALNSRVRTGKGAVPTALVSAVTQDAAVFPVLSRQARLGIEADLVHAATVTDALTENQLNAALALRSVDQGIGGAKTLLGKAMSKTGKTQGTAEQVASLVLAATPSGYPGNLTLFKKSANRLADAQSDLAAIALDLGSLANYVATHPANRSSSGPTG